MITLVSLLFITMIPNDCKIINFSNYLFVCFFTSSAYHFKRKNNYQKSVLACTQLLNSRKSASQYTSCSLIENSMKSISTYNQSSHYRKHEMFNRQSVPQLLIYIMGVLRITMLHFQLLHTL